jgi:hypothetical protein
MTGDERIAVARDADAFRFRSILRQLRASCAHIREALTTLDA